MFLAKVKGNVVATQKNSNLTGNKLLVIHPVNEYGDYIGSNTQVAIDQLGAGIGDTVMVVKEGAAVQQILGHSNAPVHTIIVAIVDDIDLT